MNTAGSLPSLPPLQFSKARLSGEGIRPTSCFFLLICCCSGAASPQDHVDGCWRHQRPEEASAEGPPQLAALCLQPRCFNSAREILRAASSPWWEPHGDHCTGHHLGEPPPNHTAASILKGGGSATAAAANHSSTQPPPRRTANNLVLPRSASPLQGTAGMEGESSTSDPKPRIWTPPAEEFRQMPEPLVAQVVDRVMTALGIMMASQTNIQPSPALPLPVPSSPCPTPFVSRFPP